MKILCSHILCVIGLGLSSLLVGCGTNLSAAIDTARALSPFGDRPLVIQKNPQYSYLNVQLKGQKAIFVLGYVDPSPQGPVEVWYGRGVTLSLLNGRLVGLVGEGSFIKQWPRVTLAYPYDLAKIEREQVYTRTRDEMPGYRFNIKDEILVRPLQNAPRGIPAELSQMNLAWFEEESIASDGSRKKLIARYAIQKNHPKPEWVYGQQCLDADYCLIWFKSKEDLGR